MDGMGQEESRWEAFTAEHAESAETNEGLVSEQPGKKARIAEGFRPSELHWHASLLSAFSVRSVANGYSRGVRRQMLHA